MKENMQVHFSSATDNWSTPIEFFNKLDAKYNFTQEYGVGIKVLAF